MDTPEQTELRAVANRRWREALAQKSPSERRRLDRCAVYAVAVGDRMGLSDADLARLRFEVLGKADDPLLQSIVSVVAEFERAAFSDSDPRQDRAALLNSMRETADPDRRCIVDALAAVEPLIQPLEF